MTDGCRGGAHGASGPGSRRFQVSGHASLPHSVPIIMLGPEECQPTKLSEQVLIQNH